MNTRSRRLYAVVLGTLAACVVAAVSARAADLRWIPYRGGALPGNAVHGGVGANGQPFFVCMGEVNKFVQPGKEFGGNCWIAAGKEVQLKPPFDVLVEEGGAKGVWTAHPGGALPPGMVRGGTAANKEPFYVCRARVGNYVQPGKLFSGNCFVAAGKEVEVKAPNYEVLVASTGGAPAAAPAASAPKPTAPAVSSAPPAGAPAAPAGSAPRAASPSGDVTWGPAASTAPAQGFIGRLCRMPVAEGVVVGTVGGGKCFGAFGGKGVTSAQYDLLSGNTAGYRMVPSDHPAQVPGAILVGKLAGRTVWVCGARQPNGGMVMGWTQGGACATFSGNPQESRYFNANLAALAPAGAK